MPFLNKASSQGTADQASGDQTESGGCGTDGGGTMNIKIFQHRAKGSGGTVSAYHRNGTGTHAYQRIEVKNFGKANSYQVLEHDKGDDQTKKNGHRPTAAF